MMLPAARAGDGPRAVPDRAVHRHVGRLRDRADRGGHRRPTGPGFGQCLIIAAVADRRLRHHHRGDPAHPASCPHRLGIRTRLLAQAEGRSLGLANVRQVLIRVARHHGRLRGGDRARRSPPRFWLDLRPRLLRRAVWYGVFHAVLGLQQRRLRALQRQPGGLRRRLVDLPAAHARRDRWAASASRCCSSWPASRAGRRSWSTHTRLTVFGTIGLLARRLRRHARLRVGQPGAPSGRSASATRSWPRSSRARCRAPAASPASTSAPCEPETTAVVDRADVHRRRQRRHRRRHQGDHVPAARLRHLGRGPGRAGRGDRPPAHRRATVQRQALTVALLGVALVAVGTLASSRSPTGRPVRPGAVRGDLGVRHRRPEHRHHPDPAGRRRRSCWSCSCSSAGSARSPSHRRSR